MGNERNLLLRLDIDENGSKYLAGTRVTVQAHPLGNPTFAVCSNDPDFNQDQIFVRYEKSIRESAPKKANSYSVPVDWEDIHEIGVTKLGSEERLELYNIPIQYYHIPQTNMLKLIEGI